MDEDGDYIKPSTWGGTNPWEGLYVHSEIVQLIPHIFFDGLPTSDFIVDSTRIAEADDDFDSAGIILRLSMMKELRMATRL